MLGDQFNHCLYRDENRFAIGLRANVVAMDQPCRFCARESELRWCPRLQKAPAWSTFIFQISTWTEQLVCGGWLNPWRTT